ncbi:hypothetical protein L541_0899 [Bordetella hinzii CA90 BAL1384]|uniref:N-acetyltransferase YedL n=2 Tax=Bordetella hinzii TaxID=103855 RepID=A0ABR4R7F2_9BORD|nr:hypothetical protein L544_3420 [Bordetella hinzii OH87 BAL007II]KCB29646.1 hypothetical protein L541_0899 [Bordetella hinzii CA90 BAL1384]KCB40776.1 hypothetical protein L539_0837 [Bordetella hinzii 5132]
MADAALGPALNATVEIAGPERMRLAELAERYLRQIGDTRPVRADWSARYFGALLGEDTLLPGPRLGTIGFDTWFSRSGARH